MNRRKHYRGLPEALQERFGEKIMKISLDAGFSCPNRDGTLGFGGCTFCSSRGSGDFVAGGSPCLEQQYAAGRALLQKKWGRRKTIAYLQAFTNTHAPVAQLKAVYDRALALEGVVGLAIATRPDCLGEEVLDLLQRVNEKTHLWVELGLQTSNEQSAQRIHRGYPLAVYDEAMKALKLLGIETVTHVIFGLPGEGEAQMLATVDHVVRSQSDGIKLQLLHILKDTPLAEEYAQGTFRALALEEYVHLVVEALRRLPPQMTVHRLTGDAPRAELVAPLWSLEKWKVLNAIDRTLDVKNLWQGDQRMNENEETNR
ncbi:putative Fe-S oxidoreductase [Clostridiaceae bacterium JG1575]|nr:putative Fe-S oxidoreductase [Clostridiaceae bacterium JG1575]